MPSQVNTNVFVNTANYARFYSDMKRAFGKFMALGMGLACWSNAKGEGIYTYSGSRLAKALIKNAIDQKVQIGIKTPAPSKEHWQTFSEVGAYGLPWKYTGAVYRNIIARKVGRGYEVGIDRRASTRVTGFSYLSKNKGKTPSIKVEKYAAWVEFGTAWQDPNPLFSKAALYYAYNVSPKLHAAAVKSIRSLAKSYKTERVVSKHATQSASDIVGQYTQRATAGLTSSNPDKDFSSSITEAAIDGRLGQKGMQIIEKVGDLDKRARHAFEKASKGDINKIGSVVGGKEEREAAKDWWAEFGDQI